MGMVAERWTPVRYLRTLAAKELSDAELLRRYAQVQDEDAFAELVQRNGPHVFRACQHVLGETTAAEDAFQATFLLLARKASRLSPTEGLAGWLHNAAVRIGSNARRADKRRRQRERYAAKPLVVESVATWPEVRELLDAELSALPEPYRTSLVLCYLQDLTYEQAARQCGCSLGALRGRLERGKEMLRKRLAKYSLTLGTPVLVLGRPAAVSAMLVQATLATVRTALSGGTIAPAVAALVGASAATKKLAVSLLVVGFALSAMAFGFCSSEPVEVQEKSNLPARTAQTDVPSKKTDAIGDSLPPGAVAQLGTQRFHGEFTLHLPINAAKRKSYLNYQWRQYRWMDAETGAVTDTWTLPKGLEQAGISPDGRWALLAHSPHQSFPVYLYDLANKQEVKRFAGHVTKEGPSRVGRCCISLDGKWIATPEFARGDDKKPMRSLNIWSLATGTKVWSSGEVPKVTGYHARGFTPAGALIYTESSGDHCRVKIADAAQGRITHDFPGWVAWLASDGVTMLLGKSPISRGGMPDEVQVWNCQTDKKSPFFKESRRRFAFTPDGRMLLSARADGEIVTREAESGKELRTMNAGRPAEYLLVSEDSRTLTVGFHNTLIRHDLQTGKPLPSPGESHFESQMGMACTDDDTLVSFDMAGVLRTWNRQTSGAILQPLGQPYNTRGLAVHFSAWGPGFAMSADGKRVATAEKSQLMLWDRTSGKSFRAIPHDLINPRLTLSPDGKWLVASGQSFTNDDNAIFAQIWDATTAKRATEFTFKEAARHSNLDGVAFTSDGRHLAIAAEGQTQVWHVPGWKLAYALPHMAGPIAFSQDQRVLHCLTLKGLVMVELASRQERASTIVGQIAGSPLAVSPSGRLVALLRAENAVEVWDVYRQQRVAVLQGDDGPVQALMFVDQGKQLVTSHAHGTLLVWDVAEVMGQAPLPALLKEKQLQKAWDDLASPDAARPFAAICALCATPEQSVALLAKKLQPAPPLDGATVRRLLASLDSPKFEDRERASKELKALLDRAESHLTSFLAAAPSEEARRRAHSILEAITGLVSNPERLRQLRAVEVLEHIGTRDARGLLREIARGAPDAGLTRDAHAALKRLSRKPPLGQ